MDATTTPSTVQLLKQLTQDYPALTFARGDGFEWQPHTTTVVYDLSDPHFDARLLHEVGHSILQHSSYDRDIDLIRMERDAWQEAKLILAPRYHITISADDIDADMDTYREWLHARSTCPDCQSSGIQTGKQTYTCVTCRGIWRVNEARSCALRRYKV